MTRPTRRLPCLVAGLLIASVGVSGPSPGAIYNWETGEVIPGTAAITPGPGVDLSGWNTPGHTLESANFGFADLTNASFEASDLTRARFDSATLTNANFAGAIIKGADLRGFTTSPTGFTSAQLYSTASYIDRDLSDIQFGDGFDKSGWNFAGQNLSGARFDGTLDGADFTQANLALARFSSGSLANVNFSHADLTNASFPLVDLAGTNFTNANLTQVNFEGVTLASADLTGAMIQKAIFTNAKGLTAAKLMSTASYINRDLSGVKLPEAGVNLTGVDFAGHNLTGASMRGSTLTNANFTGAVIKGLDLALATGFTTAQLASTASYANHDLSGVAFPNFNATGFNLANQDLTDANLGASNLTNADFSHGNLTRARLGLANITNANFAGAVITGANFNGAAGFNINQIYSTASYAQKDLSGIVLNNLNLTGINLANQNLIGAVFQSSNLTNAVFTGADMREAFAWATVASTITRNTIRPDGRINGLSLLADETLTIRSYRLPVRVETSAAFDPTSTLQLILEEGWTWPVRFAPGMDVHLEGTLHLDFAPGVNPASLHRKSYRIFDWTINEPTGAFSIVSPYTWDLSRLYTTGEVTLVPEPGTWTVMLAGLLAFGLAGRRMSFAR